VRGPDLYRLYVYTHMCCRRSMDNIRGGTSDTIMHIGQSTASIPAGGYWTDEMDTAGGGRREPLTSDAEFGCNRLDLLDAAVDDARSRLAALNARLASVKTEYDTRSSMYSCLDIRAYGALFDHSLEISYSSFGSQGEKSDSTSCPYGSSRLFAKCRVYKYNYVSINLRSMTLVNYQSNRSSI